MQAIVAHAKPTGVIMKSHNTPNNAIIWYKNNNADIQMKPHKTLIKITQ